MLEKIPHWLGDALKGVRAGHDRLTLANLDLNGAATLHFSSPAFANGDRLPPRFTADGHGLSPPLVWGEVPQATESLALIVEDPDAPTPRPMVHALVVDIDPGLGGLREGSIAADGDGAGGKNVGKNSRLAEGWLPPDPPTGHGPHDYVFQLLALGPGGTSDSDSPGRSDFVSHVESRILAVGLLVGTYSRGDPALVGRAEAAAAPV